MTNLREKAEAVRKHGEAERNNYEPTGAPMRAYNYWLKHSNSAGAREIRNGVTRENFCHFWRVVAIWSPLMAFRRGATKVVTHPVAIVLFLLTALAAVIWSVTVIEDSRVIAAVAAGLVWTALGLTAGVAVGYEGWRNALWWEKVFVVITLPVSILAYGVASLVRNWKKSWNRPLGNVIIALVALAGLTGLVAVLVNAVQDFGVLWTLLGIAGLLAGSALVIGFFYSLATLGEWLGAARRARKEAALERHVQDIVAGNDEPAAPRKPGKVAAFFTGVADFIIFISQVVRVKKWKICPLVTVESGGKNV